MSMIGTALALIASVAARAPKHETELDKAKREIDALHRRIAELEDINARLQYSQHLTETATQLDARDNARTIVSLRRERDDALIRLAVYEGIGMREHVCCVPARQYALIPDRARGDDREPPLPQQVSPLCG